MFAAGFFELPAALLAWFYSFTNNYSLALALIAVVVMLLITPLTLKSTKGMLEMQRLAPEMRKLQAEHRNDRQKLNEEMMKLYQEHKVNPMASCLPLLAQMPVFLIMVRIVYGLTYKPSGTAEPIARAVLAAGDDPNITAPGASGAALNELGFLPRFISTDSKMFSSLAHETEMSTWFNFDLSRSGFDALGDGISTGLPYVIVMILLGTLYFLQQRMVAARAAVSPTMSPTQQKMMQYLPVAFAVFQIILPAALVVYYIAQAILRIAQQGYITRRFYGHEESLGRQAQRANEKARELAKQDGGGGGLFAQAKQQLAGGGESSSGAGSSGSSADPKSGSTKKSGAAKKSETGHQSGSPSGSKRTTPPKQRPTPPSKRTSSRPGSGKGSKRPPSSAKRRR